MKIRFHATAFILAALLLAAACPRQAQARDYVMLIPMVEGLAEGAFSKVLKDFTAAVSKKTGIPLKWDDMKYPKGAKIGKKVLEAVKAGKADVVQMNGLDYLMVKNEVDDLMYPVFSMTLMKKPYTEACAFVRADSPYKTIADLKGKRWGGTDTMHSRYLMLLEGIDKPVDDHFGSMSYILDSDTKKPLDALLANKIDIYITSGFVVDMVRNADKNYAKGIRELKCAEYEHNWIFFASKKMDKEHIKTLVKTILQAHKDKDFAQFHFMLTAIKGNFIPFKAEELDTTKKILKLATDKGWLKEEQAWLKKHQD
jgi:ABC-type phosphate/phosphonate transport system substrate-binding protein